MSEGLAAATRDVPLGGLPSADGSLLAKAPLELAIVEVKFTSTASEVPVGLATQLRDELAAALDLDFPNIQPVTQNAMQIDFNAQGASWSGDQSKGWQVSSADAQMSATIFPGSFIWQVGSYEKWNVSMRAPLKVLVGAVQVELRPVLTQRVGLRYVDRFSDPTCRKPADWSGKIVETLLGPIGNPTFGNMVRGLQQQVEIALDARHGAMLRHGPLSDQTSKTIDYLIDLDVFAHGSSAFDDSQIVETADRLNRTALSLFQACVSANYLSALRRGVEG